MFAATGSQLQNDGTSSVCLEVDDANADSDEGALE